MGCGIMRGSYGLEAAIRTMDFAVGVAMERLEHARVGLPVEGALGTMLIE